jgi:hypothetical protein
MKHILALLGLLTGTVAAHCQPAGVYSDAGNIFIERAGGATDGRRLYFLSSAWATSDALHAVDVRGGEEHFLLPADDFLVLNFCRSKYKDHLVVLSRRYFLFGGSYEWYWLYDPAGKKELGPVGHFDNREDLIRQADGKWCEGKP